MKQHPILHRLLAAPATVFLAFLAGHSASAQVTGGGTFGDSITVQAATAGEAIPTASADNGVGADVLHAFDTEIGTTGGTYILDPASSDPTEIALSAGRHLVMYNAEFNSASGTDRAEIQSKLNLNGADLVIGRSQGYIRDWSNVATACITTGGAIITVAADDQILKLASFRSDTNPGQNVVRRDGLSTMQILKIENSWDHLSLEQLTTNGPSMTTAWGDVTYNTVVDNSGTAFAFTGGSGDITLNEAGLYLVFANTGLQKNTLGTNATRTSFLQRLSLDGVGVAGTTVATYMRGDSNTNDCHNGIASNGAVINAGAGQVLNVEISKVTGNDSTVMPGETAITIVKLPPTAKYMSLLDTTEQPINDATVDPVVFNTQVTPSNSEFTHTIGGSAVTVNTTSKYLFFGGLYTEDDTTNDNADRTVARTGWQIDGAGGQLAYGQGAEYMRDNGNSNKMGNWCGAVLDLTATQTVELMTERMANGDPAEGDEMALFGLSIQSLEPTTDPVVFVNNPLTMDAGATATITTSLLSTYDADTAATALTYTVDTTPVAGTLNHTVDGAIGMGGTFTQDDIDNNRVEFVADFAEAPGGFDFTVSDTIASDSSTFAINVVWPTTTVTIAADMGEVTEGGTASWTVSTTPAPVSAGMTVDIAYSGTAEDGSDFTGVATVAIADGATIGALSVTTSADTVFEGCEVIVANITGVSGTTVNPVIGTPGEAAVSIMDGPSTPTASNIEQLITGSGVVPIADIVASNHAATYVSSVNTTASPFFHFNGETNITTFTDGRADEDFVFNDPGYLEPPGMSIDIEFTPQSADLTGSVVIVEIGGQQNGTSIILVDGVLHLISKAGAANEDMPVDAGDPGYQDYDWDGNAIAVPLTLDGLPLTADLPTRVAVVYDISGGSLKWSLNGSAETVITLLNQDSDVWSGANSNTIGEIPLAPNHLEIGAQNLDAAAANPFSSGGFSSLAGGHGAVSCLRLWNESTGSVTAVAGDGGTDEVTATLTINGWVSGAGYLTDASSNGETYDSGVWTITGPVAAVNAALEDTIFISEAGTADPTVISVAISNGTGTTSGGIVIASGLADTVYVDDSFVGATGTAIADADNGSPVSPATLGYDAYTTLTEAAAALNPGGMIVVNGGDYSGENFALTGTTAVRLTDANEAVVIGSLGAAGTNSIDIQNGDLTAGATGVNTIIDCPITGTTGTLTKTGTGDIRLLNASTFTGVTTINDGRIVVTYLDAMTRGSLASTGIVVDAPGILALGVLVDTVYTHSIPISGTGSVSSFENGTIIFDSAGPNTFSGEFNLGDGASSRFDGVDVGAKEGFVVLNDSGHLGTGKILSRGGQLQAGVPGIVIPNDIDITQGGFRNGGMIDFGFSGTISCIDNGARGFGNYGLEGLDLVATGPIILDEGSMNAGEGSNNRDNGTWTFTGDISGSGNVLCSNTFDGGVVTFSGAHTFTGTLTFASELTVYNATHTGGLSAQVNNLATLAGTGSTDAPMTVVAGGTLSPGENGVGTFGTGDLLLGGTLEIDVENTGGTAHDQLVVTGTVDLNEGILRVNQGPTIETAPAEVLIIDNDTDVDVLIGNFSTPIQFISDYFGSGLFGEVNDFDGGDGNDVTVKAGMASIIGQWLDNYGATANTGAGANDADAGDNDGLVNLLEFGFGTNPLVSDNRALLADGSVFGVPWPDGAMEALFLQRTDYDEIGSVSYTVEFTDDLVEFYPSPDTPTWVSDTADSNYEVVGVPYLDPMPNGRPAKFFRVRVNVAE